MRGALPLLSMLACTGGGVSPQVDLSLLDDQDQDGHPAETDCDDDNAAVHPAADEICDGLDNDCDGFIDAADDDATGLLLGFIDADGDGFGATEVDGCDLPEGAVEVAGDCDDGNAEVHPDATESCSTTADDDCSGTVNDPGALGCSDWYVDQDGDGHGSGDPTCLCFGEADYSSASSADCDDTDAETHPDAPEICDDGWDHDCDGSALACRLSETYEVDDADLYLLGMEAGGRLGESLTLSEDLSGDGLPDLLVFGAPGGGLLWVVEASGSGDEEMSTGAFILNPSAEMSAISTAFGEDLGGDGAADLVVGSPSANGEAGLAAVFLGPLAGSSDLSSAWALWSGSAGDQAGSVAWAGDLHGTGAAFFAVGAPGSGGIYIAEAERSGNLSLRTDAQWIEGETDTIASAGDTDGDGLSDMLIGHSSATDGGVVYLLNGPVEHSHLADADAFFRAEDNSDLFGYAVAGVGDVNGDGHDDVLIGAPGNATSGTQSGAAWLYAGPLAGELSPEDALARIDGSAAKDLTGTAVCGPGDLDGDGYAEVAVSAPDNDEGASGGGMVGLFYGPMSGTQSLDRGDALFVGEQIDDHLGQSLHGGKDLDGNGRPDIIIGVPGSDEGAPSGGGAALWSGLGY
jgi:hypothetical protein